MNLWQNPEHDLGQPLSRQQQLLASNGNDGPRSYWFELSSELSTNELKQKLMLLMQTQQALSTYYAKPVGFDVIRQQVQQPRLSLNVFANAEALEFTESVKRTLETEAQSSYQQEQPHLLVWCWPRTDTIMVQIVASSLMLDNYSAYNLYQQIVHGGDDDETMQYPQYIDWLNELQNDEDAQLGQNYWQSLTLTELPEARLSEQQQCLNQEKQTDKSHQTHECVSITLPEELQERLANVAEQLTCTSSDIIINVWAILLSKLSACDELKLDYYHDCRRDYDEFSSAFGLFVQPLPVPFYQLAQADLAGACQGFTQLFEEIRDNQEYISMVDNLKNNRCHAGFYWHQQLKLNEMSCSTPIANNELLLNYLATEYGNGKLSLFYNSDRYERVAMERALAHFHTLLNASLDAPQKKMHQLMAQLPDEQAGTFIAQNSALSLTSLVNDSDLAELRATSNIVSLFRAQAKALPDNIAIKTNNNTMTYQQLDEITDCYAGAFQAMGAKPDTIIALCLPRTTELLVSLLAVLKSGAAYLPLDPEQPTARLQQIIDDAQPVILITELTNLAATRCISPNQLTQHKQPLQPTNIAPEHLAYVLYTSGSTGQPKGVQVEHRQITHYSQAVIKQLELPEQSHYGLISSLMADLGNTMLFPAWITGSCLHLLGNKEINDGEALAKYYQRQPLDCLKIVPSHLEALLASGQNILPTKILILGGEPIQTSLINLLRTFSPQCRLFNHYGPTETTVGVLIGEIDLPTGQSRLTATIGDNSILLLDDNMQPVISGQCGELYVSGSNVTRGYLNDSQRTAEVYLPMSAAKSAQNILTATKTSLYRTGDLAVCNADGSVSILGRNDQQIKIRGFRLDLNEIQQLLLTQEHIAQAYLQASGNGANSQLLAFVVMAKNKQLDETGTLAILRQQLPDYMVPAHIYALTQFPLNNNGKIDKQQLLTLAQAQQQQVVITPKNDIELQILTIWQEVLQQHKLCVAANFFDIGGHSLAAIKVVAKIRKKLSVNLPTDLLFKHKTIVEIANYIDSNSKTSSYLIAEAQRLLPLNNKAKTANIEKQQEPTLILMHAPAGHFNYHKQLIDNLGETFALYGLTANVELFYNLDKTQNDIITDDYIEQLLPLKHQPLTLIGWSLGGKQMMLMVNRMLALGFTINGIALIDYDPNQYLELNNNEYQLISDFKDYLDAENINLPVEVVTELTDSLNGSYQQAMQQLLHKLKIKGLLGQELTTQELEQRFMLRWKIKQMLYNTAMPKIELPLWLWHGTGHKSPAQIWQQFCTLPLKNWYLGFDHHEILNQTELSSQIINNISQLNPMVTT